MPFGPGARVRPYEIQFAIGAAATGEVYHARDVCLKRQIL